MASDESRKTGNQQTFLDAKYELGLREDRTIEQITQAANAMGASALSTKMGFGINRKNEEAMDRRRQGKDMLPGDPTDRQLGTYWNSLPNVVTIPAGAPLESIFDQMDMRKTALQKEVGNSANQSGGPGQKAIEAGSVGGATAFEKGLADLAINVKAMSDAAVKISPDNFKDVIDQSAKTLGGTLKALDSSIAGLAGTVSALNGAVKNNMSNQSSDKQTDTPWWR